MCCPLNLHYFIKPSSAGSSNIRMNKRGQRERTSEGLTKNMQTVKGLKSKWLRCQLNSNANYIRFDWVEFMITEYFRVIDAINDCYKKMLEIGKCAEVFRPVGGRQPDILTAKSKVEFQKTKKKHYLEVQLICYYRCTKTFNIHWCWNCTGPKKIR